MTEEREFSLIILETVDQQIVLQLRDAKPTISHPNHWALFGGRVEPHEDPASAILREIAEELTIMLVRPRLYFLHTVRLEPKKVQHVYAYRLQHELQQAVLREGQRYAVWSREHIHQPWVEGYPIVPSHYQILQSYWQDTWPLSTTV